MAPSNSVKRTPELANQICQLITQGLTLRQIGKLPHMPHKSSVLLWRAEDADFADQYARARDAQAEAFAEELLEISDGKGDVQRARLKVDTRKFLMAQMAPKRWGPKAADVHVKHSWEDLIGQAIEAPVIEHQPSTAEEQGTELSPHPVDK
jgi:hypothetical protein